MDFLLNVKADIDALEASNEGNLLVLYTNDPATEQLCQECGVPFKRNMKTTVLTIDENALSVVITQWPSSSLSSVIASAAKQQFQHLHVQLPKLNYDADYEWVTNTYLPSIDASSSSSFSSITIYGEFTTTTMNDSEDDDDDLFESDIFFTCK